MREGTLAELYPTHMEAVTRIALLEIELEDAAELLQKAHPIGEVKGIGLREVATATKDICLELAALRERAGRLEGLLGKVHRLIPAYIAESDYNGIVAGLFKEIHQTIPSPTASPRKCRGCNGEKGWYSPDNGQWVQCSCDSALSTPAPAGEADQ